jgi:hypothetical protein
MSNHGFWGSNGMGPSEAFAICKSLKFKDQNATNYYLKRCPIFFLDNLGLENLIVMWFVIL